MQDSLKAIGTINLEVVHDILNKIDQNSLIASIEGDIVFANEPFLKMYGMTQQQACRLKIYDPVFEIATHERFLQGIELARQSGGKLTTEHQYTIDGKKRYSELTIVLFTVSGQERILFLAKDVTDLRHSRQEAVELNSMLNKIIDNLPVYLFVKDVDNELRYLIWNKAFAEFSKIPAEKVIGRTDFEVFPDYRDALAFRNDDLSVIENGEIMRTQESYQAADGTTRVVQTYKTLVSRQSKGPLLVGISLDITNIQGIEQELVQERLRAEESDRLKSRFLANMSHEIRTPLNAIVGFANLLSDAESDEERQEFVRIINDSSEQLLRLINDILDLSKIEAGTLEYRRQPMDLYDTCHQLQLQYRDKVAPGVRLVFDNDSAPSKFMINEDRNRLTQVLDNLLNNAIKFTQKGEIHYGFHVKGDWIEAYVSDTGKGIPADKQAEVFDRFVKLDNFSQGSGLGLPICMLIVNTFGGEMSLASEEGVGSTFTFTIPYVHDRKLNDPDLFLHHSVRRARHKGDWTILVAEDVDSNFLVLKTMIKGRYGLIRAKDGVEAVRMAKEKKPDLIFMDIKMPNMNGLDAAKEIRKFNRKVPIVAITANAYDDDHAKAELAGMNGFLPKPIRRDAFESILSVFMNKAAQEK